MNPIILFVDDEPSILRSVPRLFRRAPFQVFTCDSGEAALEVLARHEVAVLISDNRMPVMSGLELLTRCRQVSPDTVKIMLTGYADLDTAIAAINTVEVFRFVVKPWDDDQLLAAVGEAAERHRVVCSLRGADEAKLRSLAQTIELKDTYTRGHCDRVAEFSLWIAEALGLGADQRRDLVHGGWLHDCGKIGVSEQVLNKDGPLTDQEFEQIKAHPEQGAQVADQARLSPAVRNIILHHHEKVDGSGYPRGLTGEAIPLEARIVAVADVYDALTSHRPYRTAMPQAKACQILREMAGDHLDPRLTALFLERLKYERVASDASSGVESPPAEEPREATPC